MKYAAVLSILLSIPALSCGADSSDTAEQELEAEVSSRMDAFLAENGFESVNTANEPGELPLHLAVLNDDIDMVRMLIADGAEIDARGLHGSTPLSCASINGHFDIVQLLVEEGADDEELFRLENGRVGLFLVGMSGENIEEIVQVYGDAEFEEVDLMLEGMPAPAIEITFQQDTSEILVLELDIEDATVYRINISSDRFITDIGIGTASIFSDLQVNYQFDGVFWTEDGNPFIIIEELDASIILEPGEWWVMGEVEGNIPPDTKISSILIF